MHPIVNVFLVRFQTITLETHGVETTLVQCCFIVVTLKKHRIKVISTPCLAGYLFERQYRPVYKHWSHYAQGILLQSI